MSHGQECHCRTPRCDCATSNPDSHGGPVCDECAEGCYGAPPLTSAQKACVESIRAIAAAGYYRADVVAAIARRGDHAVAAASGLSCAEYPDDQDCRDRAFRRHLGVRS